MKLTAHRTRIRRTTSMRAIAVLGALSLSLGACGSGNGNADAGSPGASGDGAKASVRNTTPLKVLQEEKYTLTQIGVTAGLKQNVWADAGFEVQQIIGDKGAQALATGDADVSIGAPNRTIPALLSGLDAKIVGPTIDVWDFYVLIRSDSTIKTFNDLKGKNIGISSFGSSGDYTMRKVAASLGWKDSDLKLVTLGSINGELAGLKRGAVDAFAVSAGLAFTTEAQGVTRVLGSVKDLMGEVPVDVITVSSKVIKERPEQVKAFCEGFYKAAAALQKDRDAAKALLLEGGAEAAVIDKILNAELELISTSSSFTQEQIDGMAEATRATTTEGPGKEVTSQQVKDLTLDCSTL